MTMIAKYLVILLVVLQITSALSPAYVTPQILTFGRLSLVRTTYPSSQAISDTYPIANQISTDNKQIVFGASSLQLPTQGRSAVSNYASWEIKLITASSGIGFQLSTNQEQITWNIQVSYLIWDKTYNPIFPILENIKLTEKPFMHQAGQNHLLTFNNKEGEIEEERQRQTQLIPVTFLRGFSMKNGQKGMKMEFKGVFVRQNGAIQFINEFKHMAYCYLTILVIDRKALIHHHIILQYGPKSYSNNMQLLKSLSLQHSQPSSLTQIHSQTIELTFSQLKCPTFTRLNQSSYQCIAHMQKTQPEEHELSQEQRVAVARLLSHTCDVVIVACPSTIAYQFATQCIQTKNCQKLISQCQVGYYGTAYLSKTCTTCPTSLAFCIDCGLAYGSTNVVCEVCSMGKVVVNGVCVSCPTGCSSCKSVFGGYSCLTCYSNLLLQTSGTNKICGCLSNQYLAISPSLICVNCPTNCLTCSSTACTKCAIGFYLQTPNCLPCMPVCKSCLTASTCDSCLDTTFQMVANICQCPSPLLFNVNTIKCQTCAVIQTNCLNCVYSSAYTPSSPPNVICSVAASSYFIDVFGAPSQCMGYCTNCDPDNSVCNSCQVNFSFTTACLCSINFFYNIITNDCQICDDVIDGCTICNTNPIPVSTTCSNCDFGYMSPSGVYPVAYCQKCHILCLTCNLASGCLTCVNMDLVLLPSGLVNVCGCSGGEFLDATTLLCEPCNLIINNCQSCLADASGTISTCGTCKNNYYASSSGLTCLMCSQSCLTCTDAVTCTLCETGYVLNSGVCSCDVSCAACQSDPLSYGLCIACTLGPFACSSCQPGYYLFNPTTCTSCTNVLPGCYQCTSTACLTCSLPFIYITTTNLCDCNNTQLLYITNSLPSNCLSCGGVIPNCLSCQNMIGSTDCLVCADKYYVQMPSKSSCLPCSLPCQKCDVSATNCTSCAITFVLVSLNTCGCLQTAQFFYSSITLGCSPCSTLIPNCIDCYNNAASHTLCQQCLNPYFFNLVSQKCQLCPAECSSCSSGTVCTGCNYNLVLSQSIGLLPGFCVCNNSTSPIFYYDSTTGRCLKCQELLTSCTSCLDVGYLTCTACMPGTYLDGTCLKCPTTCATCNSTSCLSCPLDSTLDDGKCQCENSCFNCLSNSLNCLQCTFVGSVLTTCSSCLSGYYPLGENCLLCPSTCLTCTSSSSCTLCYPTFVIDSTGICGCATSLGLFPSNGVCKLCGEIIYGCKSCDIDLSMNTICASSIDGYFVSSNVCLPCHSSCLTCSGLDTTCTSCRKGQTLSVSNTCVCLSTCAACSTLIPNCATCIYTILGLAHSCEVCKAQYYVDGLVCTQCPSSCVTCTTGGVCTSCLATFQMLTGQCLCNNALNMWASVGICKYCSNIHTNCQVCIHDISSPTNTTCTVCQYTFYDFSGSCLASVCSDGKKTSGEGCDDGNLIDGDGCSMFCLQQEGFLCNGDPSVCEMILDFSITVDSIIVDTQVCNRVKVNLQMHPVHQAYKNVNFKDMLTYITNTYVYYVSWSYDGTSGIVSYTFDYFEDLNKRSVDIFFEPAKLNIIQTKKIPIRMVEVYFVSSNNIGVIYYKQEVCQNKQSLQTVASAIQYASYATLLLSALPCKIVGLEWFGVLQLAHISIGNMDNVNTLLTPIMGMKGVHGMSVKLDDRQEASGHRRLQSSNILTPVRVKSIGYSANFLRNCNIMFFIIVSIMAVSFILFLCSYICKNCAPLLYSISRRVFKQVVLTLILFNCYNFAYSAGLHFYYATSDDPLYLYGTLTAVLALVLPFMICLVLSCSSQDGFGQYKDKLKAGVLQKSYFVITIAYRTGLGVYVATMNEQQTSALIVLAISILFLLYNLVNLPFTKAYHNYRANICHMTQFVCLFVTLYYRSMMSNKQYVDVAVSFTPVYLEYSCIFLSFVVTVLVLIYEIYIFVVECCKPKPREVQVHQKQLTQNEQLKDHASKDKKNTSLMNLNEQNVDNKEDLHFAQ